MYKKLLCPLYFILLLQLTAVAQNSRFFTFNRYSTSNGMTGNKVFCTYQDAKGFIWIGGSDGLMRYDGTKFFNYYDRRAQMPFSAISSILPVSKTELMLCFPELKEVGIINLANLVYTKIPVITDLTLSPRATMSLYNCGSDIFMVFKNAAAVLKFDSTQKAFVPYRPFTVPAGWSIASMYYDKIDNNYWFSCDSGLAVYSGISRQMFSRNYNPQNWQILADKKINEANWSLFIDSKRKYWIINWPSYADQLLHCYDRGTGQYLTDTTGWTTTKSDYREIKTVTETNGGIIWAYGYNGLLSRVPVTGMFENNKDAHTENFGIRYESIHHLMEDREGSIWVSTDQGLYFSPPLNDNILNIITPMKAMVNDISQLDDGKILLNTWGDGTRLFEINDFIIHTKNLYPKTNDTYDGLGMTWCSHQHSLTKKVYIGAQAGVLGIYDPETGITEKIQDSAFDKKTIRCVIELPGGDLLFGTQGGSLVRLHDNKFQVLGNYGTVIYAMVADKNKRVWIATHNRGIYAIDLLSGREVLQILNTGETGKTISSNIVSHLALYNDSLLLAANGKLSLINTRTLAVKNIGIIEGMPGSNIQSMQMDKTGNVWLVTSNGMCRYNIAGGFFTKFSSKDGFTDPSMMEGPSALLKNGMLMFTGKEGMMMLFAPDSLTKNSVPDDVAITDIKIGNDYYPVDSLLALNEITCSPENNSISISFASLSYLQGDKLVYYYKMEGLEDNWRMITAGLLRATYSYLPPGRYTFKVKAQNINGVSSEHVTSFRLFVKPPFWRNYWFICTILFFIAIFIYVLHKMRVNKLLAVEKIRNKVARDLHDDMGSTLSTINILSAMAKSKLNNDAVKTSEYISKISENSQRMMEAMDDIVWSIKPMNDTMQRIAARMREFATNVLEAKDIEPEFIFQEKVYDVKLDMEARRDFFLVFKEAVNNAAKYSKASCVKIKMELEEKTLVLDVTDDGNGFEVKTATNGNGLGNMLKRADALKAKLVIQSQPGMGTTVKLTVPVTN
ncbi:MAG: two-component regulator propeller domain-containing protein [Ferruginibacter sp.]